VQALSTHNLVGHDLGHLKLMLYLYFNRLGIFRGFGL
jgi:hypothetical protein